MVKIASVLARTVRVPLDRATSFARRQVTRRDYALVKIRTDDGLEGIGHCYGGHGAGSLVTEAVRQLLAPVLLGRDPHDSEALWAEMYQEALLHGRAGSVMRAISILDIALWDRNARAANLPLYKYLGAAFSGIGARLRQRRLLSGRQGAASPRRGVGRLSRRGFRAVKMKVGRLDPAGEEARIAAAREAIGPDVLLMLDANNAWRDVPTALRYIERYAGYDPYWIEEPFSPDQIDNHATLAAAIEIPVATGEIEAGRWRFKEILEKRAARSFRPTPRSAAASRSSARSQHWRTASA